MTPDDKRTCAMAAAGLLEPYDYMHLMRPRVKRKPRRASIRKMVAAAEKIGKTVTSVTMPDGTVLHFGASDNEHNEWDTVLRHGKH
jgi:hypothetical protein